MYLKLKAVKYFFLIFRMAYFNSQDKFVNIKMLIIEYNFIL